MRLSQERDTVCELLSFCNLSIDFVFVWNVSIEYEWSRIQRCLESTLSRSHCWPIFRPVLDWHCLNSLSSYRLGWSILSKEFRVCHSWVIESHMVIHWPIKVLSVTHMSNVIILWALDIEVRDPAQLTVDVSILGDVGVIRHPCSLDLIHFIWVMLSSRLQQNWLLWLELLVKVLSVVSVVLSVESRGTCVETFVPLVIAWCKHTVISVFLHNQFRGRLCISWISTSQLGMGFKNVSKSLSS